MEMKITKLFALMALSCTLLFTTVTASAADRVLYEKDSAETSGAPQDLQGWGEEKFTRCIFEADVQFKALGSGFTLYNSDNTKGGTSIRAVDRNGTMTLAADGGTGDYFIYYIALDPSKWYHIKLIGNYGVQDGMIDMVVDTYDENMQITETKNYYLILMNQMYASSGVGPEHIRVEADTAVKNVKVTELMPDSVKLPAVSGTVTASDRIDMTAKFYRDGEVLNYSMPIVYSVNGEGVAVDENGILIVDENAENGSFTLTAKSGDMSDTLEMNIVSGDVFTITAAVLSEDGRSIDAVRAVKNYFYNSEAAFVAAVYDDGGILRDCFVKYLPSNAVKTGTESDIVMGYTLPSDFNAETWTVEIYAWGAGEKADLPEVTGDVAVRGFYEANGGAVVWLGEHNAVAGMINGKTTFMQIGNPDVFVNVSKITLASVPYIQDNATYVNEEFIKAVKD